MMFLPKHHEISEFDRDHPEQFSGPAQHHIHPAQAKMITQVRETLPRNFREHTCYLSVAS